MADDIDLPNLVSHLQVNLANTSGIVADATRQGSSVGAALGESLQRTLRSAVDDIPDIEIDANSTQLDRDVARVRSDLLELSSQRIGIDISLEEALRRMAELEPHLDRLQRTHPNINVTASLGGALADLEEIRLAATRLDDDDIDIDVDLDADEAIARASLLDRTLGRLGTSGARTATALLPLVGTLGKASVALGSAVPLAAGLASTLANVLPAAGLAATGTLAAVSATGALKIGLSGVSEAAALAFDPSKAKEFNAAMKDLSPNARDFVKALQGLKPQLDGIKTTVQDKLFEGLDKQITATAKTALPALKKSLVDSAGALNLMGKGVLTAAGDLGKSGALGTALDGANAGLKNLSGAPGVLVQALGQIGAAAAPAFERLTASADSALDRLSEKLTESFESGGMESSIEGAIDLVKQLGDIAGNVGTTVKEIFGAADGGGTLSALQDITAELAKVAGSDEVQAGLSALFDTIATLGAEAAPLLGSALQQIAPILEELGPPAQRLIESLGDGLGPIIDELGPLLADAAGAVGELADAFGPLLPILGDLIADTLPALQPLLDAAKDVFAEMGPVIAEIGGILSDELSPVLEQLPALVAPVSDILRDGLVAALRFLRDLLVELRPSLAELGVAFSEVMVELQPLIEEFGRLMNEGLKEIGPYLPGLIENLGKLAAAFTGEVATALRDYVIPALRTVVDILQGDWSGAWSNAKAAATGAGEHIVRVFVDLPSRLAGALATLGARLLAKIDSATLEMNQGAVRGVDRAAKTLGRLPQSAASALGNLGGVLVSAGASLINGLISGIQSRIPSVRSVLNTLTGDISDWKGPKRRDAALLTPAGKLIIKGLIDGLDAATGALKSKLGSITNLIERAISINAGNRSKTSGLGALLKRVEKDNKRLLVLAKQRDAVGVKLKAAQKKLDDLVKAKAKEAADITSGILGEANIVQGNPLVNSVTAITVGLQQALAKTKDFEADIAKLKAAGLRGDLLQQIADAGVEGGAATADALAKATPAELKKINDLQAQLAKAAASTGNTVASALYDSGIKAAQGLVDGLKKQEGAIQKQMDKIGASMVKAIKKALGIKSPSRVLADVGEMTMAGLPVGFERMRSTVARSAASVATAAVTAASRVGSVLPSIPASGQFTAAYAGGGLSAAGDTTNNFYLTGGDATPDGILRALSWQGLVGRKAA